MTTVKSVDWFRENRPEHYKFVVEEIRPEASVIVSAGVKTGKKELILIQNRLDKEENKSIHHIYLTALDRKDIIEQYEEYRAYDIDVVVGQGRNKTGIQELEDLTAQYLETYDEVVIHFDESDYGTGASKSGLKSLMGEYLPDLLARFWLNGVKFVFYSATNEEAIYSDLVEEWKVPVRIMPNPPTFYGPQQFLDNNQIIEAEPFWLFETNTLSSQAKLAIEDWLNTDKPMSILRASRRGDLNKLTSKGSQFKKILKKYNINVVGVSQKYSYYWGKDIYRAQNDRSFHDSWWRALADYKLLNKRTLVVVEQTFTRSTEMGCHPLICFYHEYRPSNSDYNTVAQAQQRVVYYPSTYQTAEWTNLGFNKVAITVYGCVATWKYAAGHYKSGSEYKDVCGRNFSQRVKLGKSKYRVDGFVIDASSDTEEIKAKCNQKLQELGWSHHTEVVAISRTSLQGRGRGGRFENSESQHRDSQNSLEAVLNNRPHAPSGAIDHVLSGEPYASSRTIGSKRTVQAVWCDGPPAERFIPLWERLCKEKSEVIGKVVCNFFTDELLSIAPASKGSVHNEIGESNVSN